MRASGSLDRGTYAPATSRGYSEAMGRGIELALTLVVVGGIGWLVDRAVGTYPLFTVIFSLAGFAGISAKLWLGYDLEMRKHDQDAVWNRGSGVVPSDPRTPTHVGRSPDGRRRSRRRVHQPGPRSCSRAGGRPLQLLRRGLLLCRSLAVGFVGWGLDGVASVASACLVLANFWIAAAMLGWAARISLGLLMGVSLFGFLLRLAFISVAVLTARHQPWVVPIPLGVTLVVAHLGLLFWETRYVSASLAFPGLKPASQES